VIGDRKSDIQLAQNLGCNAILIGSGKDKRAVLTTNDWHDVYRFIVKQPRTAHIRRKTSETDIDITLNLDGQGKSRIKCQLGFLTHMLELLAKHGKFDLKADIKGDLAVDEHHTVEDTGIVLGQVFSRALGSKRGIKRYGFLLPMDESYAEVAVDFSGRSHLTWKVKFKRETIGEMPTELFQHFFKSFSDHARCNIYIRAKGENEHHKIEAVFKSFSRALHDAVQKDQNDISVPSTKGIL
jgi:imidazoleglycerol-phosphate dehydratase/histidinol-phosphatase